MNAQAFINRCEFYFGRWPNDYKKNEIFEFIHNGYTEKELDLLYDECEKQLPDNKPLGIHQLIGILPPSPLTKKFNEQKHRELPPPIVHEFTTKTARQWAERELKPFFEPLPCDMKLENFLDENDRYIMRNRSATFIEVLRKLLYRERIAG